MKKPLSISISMIAALCFHGNLYSSFFRSEDEKAYATLKNGQSNIKHDALKSLPYMIPHLPEGELTQKEIDALEFGLELYNKGVLSKELTESINGRATQAPAYVDALVYIGSAFLENESQIPTKTRESF